MATSKKKVNSKPNLNNPRSLKKRSAILKGAAQLFLQKNYGDISMDEICQHAEVSKRTLYNHFPTKKELFMEVLKLEWEKLLKVPSQAEIESIATRLPEEVFATGMNDVLEAMFSNKMKRLLTIVLTEAHNFPELKSYRGYGMGPLFDMFEFYIEKLDEAGYIKAPDAGLAASQYLGMIKEHIYWPWFFGTRGKPSEEEQDRVIEAANKMFFDFYKT